MAEQRVEPLSAKDALLVDGLLNFLGGEPKNGSLGNKMLQIGSGSHIVIDRTLPPTELAAALARLLPEGYAIVPVEPFNDALNILKAVADHELGNCNAYRDIIAAGRVQPKGEVK